MLALVVLPGALMLPASELLQRLATGRRVIAITYPAVERMSELVDAIAHRLSAEGVDRCDLLGTSYGGWVAQCLASRHPGLVRDLILVQTFALGPADAWRFRFGLRLWNWIPDRVFRGLARYRIARVLLPVKRRSASRYERLLQQARAGIAAADSPLALRRQNLCLLDSCVDFASTEPQAPGRTLIIESDDDPIIRGRDRARLRALHPAAQLRSFSGTGHVIALAQPEAFAEAIESFLDPAG